MSRVTELLCTEDKAHAPHLSDSELRAGDKVHCPGRMFDKGTEPSMAGLPEAAPLEPGPESTGTVQVLGSDGNPVELTAGSSLKLDDGLLLVVMTQDDYNAWPGTRGPLDDINRLTDGQ